MLDKMYYTYSISDRLIMLSCCRQGIHADCGAEHQPVMLWCKTPTSDAVVQDTNQ